MNPPQIKHWRILRRGLVAIGVFLTVLGLFYTEENWRGHRAWDNCKHALAAQGMNLDWAGSIPAPVPDDKNVFGVPEMQQWFVGQGTTELSKKLTSYPGFSEKKPSLFIANLTIGLPGTSVPSNKSSTVLQWEDPRVRTEAQRLIKGVVGPLAVDPVGIIFMLHRPEEIQPAQIFLSCQNMPTDDEVRQFVPARLLTNTTFPDSATRVAANGHNSFSVTMDEPDNVAEFLNWTRQFDPDFALIRKALQRPYSRMNGDYNDPLPLIPIIPNFVSVRTIVQRLAAMTQCHLALGEPEQALRDLTLMHDLCRICEESRPMTLVASMIDVAVGGLYVDTLADGLSRDAWREPQLATLEAQLQSINLLSPVKEAFETQPAYVCHLWEAAPPARLFDFTTSYPHTNAWTAFKESFVGGIFPRGWVYQNMVVFANRFPKPLAGLDSVSQNIFPDKVEAAVQEEEAVAAHWSPYTCLAAGWNPNFKAIQVCAQNQTMINQALVACALERYHLAHGEYPESLDALAPQFIVTLPHDVIGGQPLHYRRAADGTFILYSIGWNGRDHGGQPGKPVIDGDWVWLASP